MYIVSLSYCKSSTGPKKAMEHWGSQFGCQVWYAKPMYSCFMCLKELLPDYPHVYVHSMHICMICHSVDVVSHYIMGTFHTKKEYFGGSSEEEL